ncbi:hypothetical protein LUZ63_013453 [Rhynchospora breviuscula]|uniref:Uncharacterized protein n=1 Tax=Rhynchospora breviuscula TaxID=2022672 RepID=A0A9Q0C8N4_9POAL|nr:hypothetical protein LUZ63_013453 [Rhynchospora breviuscula]
MATKRALAGSWEDLMPPSENELRSASSKRLYSLEITDTDAGAPLTGVFSGNLSLDLNEVSTWRIKVAMWLRGDWRSYISTVSADQGSQQEDNSWQSFVYLPKDTLHVAKVYLLNLKFCFQILCTVFSKQLSGSIFIDAPFAFLAILV